MHLTVSCVITGLDMDSCDPMSFSSLWTTDSFAPPDSLKGLDKTSLLGSSMSVGDKHFVVSASGFGKHHHLIYCSSFISLTQCTHIICRHFRRRRVCVQPRTARQVRAQEGAEVTARDEFQLRVVSGSL
jgi:hypothetical protein